MPIYFFRFVSQLDLSYYGLKELPRFGKDHLALADWRLSIPHQRRVAARGDSLAAVQYEFDHPDGKKRVSLEGGATIGLPSNTDDLFLIGLLTLASALDFPAKLHFEPSHILRLLRMPLKDRHIISQRKAYERFVALTAMFEEAWFDRKSKVASGDFITGILAEVYYEPKRGRRRKGQQPASYVQFTNNFYESLLRGNIINIDLELLSAWSSPTAALHYRHLNKVWHHGRKPFPYSRDLKDIACGHLQMTNGKNLKENYSKVLKEMELKRYLQPMSKEKRFESIRHGIWRVHFQLHPDRVIQPKQAAKPEQGDAATMVKLYAELRHGTNTYEPAAHELKHAASLITEFGVNAITKVTPQVVEIVKKQNQDDVYFGFAVRYYQQQLQRQKHANAESLRQSEATAQAETDRQRLDVQQHQRANRRDQRMQVWREADHNARQTLVQRAVKTAVSETVRDRILNSSLDTPAPEVLRQIAITPTP